MLSLCLGNRNKCFSIINFSGIIFQQNIKRAIEYQRSVFIHSENVKKRVSFEEQKKLKIGADVKILN